MENENKTEKPELPNRIERIDLLEVENLALQRKVLAQDMREKQQEMLAVSQRERELREAIAKKYSIAPTDKVMEGTGMILRSPMKPPEAK